MVGMPSEDDAGSSVRALFAREVPEIESGVVEIRAIARIRGRRTKIAVVTRDPAVDPIGACVGPEGVRVQRVSAALGKEPIDIVGWPGSIERRIRCAMAPVPIIRIELDSAANHARVFVPGHGPRFGSGDADFIALASHLTGWQIDVIVDPNVT
jgi:N utilization substance protein A